MTLDREQLGKVMRAMGRRAAFYVVDLERSQPNRVVLRSSRAMPTIRSSRDGFEVHWDERFFQFARHMFRAIADPDRRIALPTSSGIASFHLESVIWCALAERALNPDSRDIDLAMGIVLQSSVFLHHSMKVLGPFDEAFEEDEGLTNARMAIFEQFVSEHELSHYLIKTGSRPSEKMLANAGVAMKLIDQRLAALTERGDAAPEILELVRFASEARSSKPIMEEIWADTLALEQVLKDVAETYADVQLPPSLVNWLVAQGAMYGVATLRLLGLIDALSAKTAEEFEAIWERQRRQFTARESYIRLILSGVIARSEEIEEPTHDEQIERINDLSNKLYQQVRLAEVDWRERWLEGRLEELRAEGRGSIERRKFDDASAINFCGERLGWFRGQPLSSPAMDMQAAISDEEAAEIANLGHLVHMMRGKTPEGRTAFYFILIEPEHEKRFRAALADDGNMDLREFGRVIASNYGDRPSAEIVAYLSDRFGFDVPDHALPADDGKDAVVDPNSAVGILRHFAQRSLRAVVVFAVAYAAEQGERSCKHALYLTFDMRFDGVELPDWLAEREGDDLTVVLQHQFEALEYDDVAFAVTLSFGGREARIRVPFLAVSRFSDPNRSIDLDFPACDPSQDMAEQNFLELAIAIVGLDLLDDQIDYATIEQRAHRAALIWIMSAFAKGIPVPDGDAFHFDLDPGAMTTTVPPSWRREDGGVAITISDPLPSIMEVGEPVGWRIRHEGADEVLIPVRAIRRFAAISGNRDFELRFDRPHVDRVRPH